MALSGGKVSLEPVERTHVDSNVGCDTNHGHTPTLVQGEEASLLDQDLGLTVHRHLNFILKIDGEISLHDIDWVRQRGGSNTSDSAADQLLSVGEVLLLEAGVQVVLVEFVEEELEGGEWGDFHDGGAISLEESTHSLLLVHQLE
uniref:Uncharacterized protein n=1 Tax=Strombidium inclinatum TaxID=197538 RepID=A0A7S3MYT0_9SPIT